MNLIMSDKKMILVGCGNMGRAMLEGWIDRKMLLPNHVYVVEPNSALHERPQALGCIVVSELASLPRDLTVDFILFAIKPQLFDQVMPAYAAFSRTCTFISVLAGIPSSRFEQRLGRECALIRVMPNTPAAVGEGVFAFCDNGHVEEEHINFVERLLGASGVVVRVREEQMDAVTAVSGSGPAYVFYLIECLTQAGIGVGLEAETALVLARQTVKGAGILAATAEASPAVLRQQVTSPNGTTAAGLAVLMGESRLQNLVGECVNAARDRSIELGK